MKQSKLCLGITLGVLVFLYLPIFLLILSSFNESRFGGVFTGFTLKWYQKLFQEKELWLAVKNSLVVGILATFCSTIIGTIAAFALQKSRSFLQKIHYSLMYTPLIMPDILMGMSLLLFFVALNFSLGLFTVFIAHTTFCISYVTMIMLSKWQTFDFSLVEAAEDLGAKSWTLFKRVVLPLLTPALLAASLLAFTLSIDDFVITYFVVGQGTTTLPVYIYSMIKFGTTPVINALSTIIIVLTFIVVWLTQILSKEEI